MAGRSMRRRAGLAAVPSALVALLAGACNLELVGGGDFSGGEAGPTLDAAGDGGGIGVDADATLEASGDADSATDAPRDVSLVDRVVDAPSGDACPDGGCPPTTTCKTLLATYPGTPTGVYFIDPDGPIGKNLPFPVLCDMASAGGGWTLVGRELMAGQGQFLYLDADSMNAAGIAAGGQTGLLGARFLRLYDDVWIDWGAGSYIRFTRPALFDLFGNVLNTSVTLTNVTTSEATLASWIASAGGAKMCMATHDNDVRPGNTSWSINPSDDNHTECGCSGGGWAGRGAYYGGVPNGMQSACTGYGGGWAGVKDDGEVKGGIVPSSETRIWIR